MSTQFWDFREQGTVKTEEGIGNSYGLHQGQIRLYLIGMRYRGFVYLLVIICSPFPIPYSLS